MSSQNEGAALKLSLSELLQKMDDLKMQRFSLKKTIEQLEAEKTKVQDAITEMGQKVGELDERIGTLIGAKDVLDANIQSSEEAVRKIADNTKVLVAMAQKSSDILKEVFQP